MGILKKTVGDTATTVARGVLDAGGSATRRAIDFKPVSGKTAFTRFQKALDRSRAKMDPQSRMQVSPFDAEKFQGKVYLTPEGDAGFAIADDGEVVHLFSDPESGTRGTMDAALIRARAEGATHLNAFENLADSYSRRGAVETRRLPWDSEMARKDMPEWDEATMGTPDYVSMSLDGVPNEKDALLRDSMWQELEASMPRVRAGDTTNKSGQLFGAPPGTTSMDDAARFGGAYGDRIQDSLDAGIPRDYFYGDGRDAFELMSEPGQASRNAKLYALTSSQVGPELNMDFTARGLDQYNMVGPDAVQAGMYPNEMQTPFNQIMDGRSPWLGYKRERYWKGLDPTFHDGSYDLSDIRFGSPNDRHEGVAAGFKGPPSSASQVAYVDNVQDQGIALINEGLIRRGEEPLTNLQGQELHWLPARAAKEGRPLELRPEDTVLGSAELRTVYGDWNATPAQENILLDLETGKDNLVSSMGGELQLPAIREDGMRSRSVGSFTGGRGLEPETRGRMEGTEATRALMLGNPEYSYTTGRPEANMSGGGTLDWEGGNATRGVLEAIDNPEVPRLKDWADSPETRDLAGRMAYEAMGLERAGVPSDKLANVLKTWSEEGLPGVRELVRKGLAPAAAVTFLAGMTATPESEQPLAAGLGRGVSQALKNTRKAVSRARNDVGRFSRGGRQAGQDTNLTPDNAMLRQMSDINNINGWVRSGAISPEEGAAAVNEIWENFTKLQKQVDNPVQPNQQNIPTAPYKMGPDHPTAAENTLVSGSAADPFSGPGEFARAPFRRQRPLTPDEASDYTLEESISRQMSQLPEGYGIKPDRGGYYDPFTMGLRQKEVDNALGPGNRQTMAVAGAPGAAYAIDSDEEDAGVLVDSVAEEDGRVFALAPTRQEIISDIPGLVGGALSEWGGMIAGGLAATTQAVTGAGMHELGLLSEAPDIDQLAETVEGVRSQFPGISEDNAAARGIEEWLMNSPDALNFLVKALGIYDKGADMADELGPQASIFYRSAPQAFLEIF